MVEGPRKSLNLGEPMSKKDKFYQLLYDEQLRRGMAPEEADLWATGHRNHYVEWLKAQRSEPEPVNWRMVFWVFVKIAQVLRFLF